VRMLFSPSLFLFSNDAVTTPTEIVPYYRLKHSIWSLSDNKESSCLLGQNPVNHLKHTERIEMYTLKLPRRRVQSVLHDLNLNSPLRFNYYKPWFMA
jgi:hypothetical protein